MPLRFGEVSLNDVRVTLGALTWDSVHAGLVRGWCNPGLAVSQAQDALVSLSHPAVTALAIADQDEVLPAVAKLASLSGADPDSMTRWAVLLLKRCLDEPAAYEFRASYREAVAAMPSPLRAQATDLVTRLELVWDALGAPDTLEWIIPYLPPNALPFPGPKREGRYRRADFEADVIRRLPIWIEHERTRLYLQVDSIGPTP